MNTESVSYTHLLCIKLQLRSKDHISLFIPYPRQESYKPPEASGYLAIYRWRCAAGLCRHNKAYCKQPNYRTQAELLLWSTAEVSATDEHVLETTRHGFKTRQFSSTFHYTALVQRKEIEIHDHISNMNRKEEPLMQNGTF